MRPLIPAAYNPENYLPFSIPGIGVLTVILTLTLIGAFAAGYVGRLALRFGESLVARMPVVRSIYGTIKQIVETVLAKKSGAFREVVMLEYPRAGVWSIGFVTGAAHPEVQRRFDGEMVHVFIPCAPPTAGYLVTASRREVQTLDMTVEEGKAFFHAVPSIRDKLETLERVGLGYIHIGQAATTLSGGEAQRVKLSKELSRRATGRTLYILDEPTTGLHFADVEKLLEVLHALVDQGNTVLVIEHNLEVIKTADWVIDLGPEGGSGGGQVVAAGTPEAVAQAPGSYTGRYLLPYLAAAKRQAAD